MIDFQLLLRIDINIIIYLMYNYIDEIIKWIDINIMREYFKVYSLVDQSLKRSLQ
ncbi:hypothetical protein pb186bvf_010632 [Paramecium bursaria]